MVVPTKLVAPDNNHKSDIRLATNGLPMKSCRKKARPIKIPYALYKP
jgi:hypothetical protein